MNITLPHNSSIIEVENDQELQEILDRITGTYCNEIKEIAFIESRHPAVYIEERQNIIIVKHAGFFDGNSEKIIADFYAANGFGWY